MRWFHKIGVSFLDLMIIVIALWYIMLSVAPLEGMAHIMTTDGMRVAFVVFITYIALVVFAEILVVTGGMAGDAWFARAARAIITTLIVVLGFPWIIKRIFLFMGLKVAADVENILFVTAFIRFLLRWWLGRRWKDV
jgi:hypothetical protein